MKWKVHTLVELLNVSSAVLKSLYTSVRIGSSPSLLAREATSDNSLDKKRRRGEGTFKREEPECILEGV